VITTPRMKKIMAAITNPLNLQAELSIRGPLTVTCVTKAEKKRRGDGGVLPRAGL
jgi:hypothetical protein